jgi:hypothetical protein
MKYEYTCACGYEVVFNTDMKAPRSVKCKTRGCKKTIRRKDLLNEPLQEGEDAYEEIAV